MSDADIQLQADGPGKAVDCTTVTTSGTVYRQRISIASPSTATNCEVLAAPVGNEAGLLVRNIQPPATATLASLDDVTSTTTPTAFSALARGPVGIMVTNHGLLGSGTARVSGPDVSATHGQPILQGQSVIFQVLDASALHHVAEAGASPKLCVSAV